MTLLKKIKMRYRSVSNRITPKKYFIIWGSLVLFFILAALGFLMRPAYSVDHKTRLYFDELITQQEKIETSLRAYYHADEYSFTTQW